MVFPMVFPAVFPIVPADLSDLQVTCKMAFLLSNLRDLTQKFPLEMWDIMVYPGMSINGGLVGGLNPSEKYESIGMISNPIYGKILKMATKPPTRGFMMVNDGE